MTNILTYQATSPQTTTVHDSGGNCTIEVTLILPDLSAYDIAVAYVDIHMYHGGGNDVETGAVFVNGHEIISDLGATKVGMTGIGFGWLGAGTHTLTVEVTGSTFSGGGDFWHIEPNNSPYELWYNIITRSQEMVWLNPVTQNFAYSAELFIDGGASGAWIETPGDLVAAGHGTTVVSHFFGGNNEGRTDIWFGNSVLPAGSIYWINPATGKVTPSDLVTLGTDHIHLMASGYKSTLYALNIGGSDITVYGIPKIAAEPYPFTRDWHLVWDSDTAP